MQGLHSYGAPRRDGGETCSVADRATRVRGAWLGGGAMRGSVPPLAVLSPVRGRAADLLSSVIIRTLPLPLHGSDLRAKPVDLRPSALQLILKLYDSPLLLHQKAAAKRQL